MIRGKQVRTVSEHERLKKGIHKRTFIYADETKEGRQAVSVWSWTQFYHKPYENDWQQAHQKAVERKLRYKNETIHDSDEG